MIFNPDKISNIVSTILTHLIECQLSFKKMIVSSTNWRCVKHIVPPICTPFNIPNNTACWINSCKTWVTIVKRRGEIGYLCRSPQYILNSHDGLPLINTDCLTEEIIDDIQALHLWPKPIPCNVCNRKFQLTVSKTFSKSSFKITPFVCFFWILCNISLVIKIESAICLPFINADCFSAMSAGNRVLILLDRIFKMIFVVVFIRLIGVKFDICNGVGILGINGMKEELMPFGWLADWWKFLMRLLKLLLTYSQNILMYFALNPSGPGALFTSSSRRALMISASLNCRSNSAASLSLILGNCSFPRLKHPLMPKFLNLCSKCSPNNSLTWSRLEIYAPMIYIPEIWFTLSLHLTCDGKYFVFKSSSSIHFSLDFCFRIDSLVSYSILRQLLISFL